MCFLPSKLQMLHSLLLRRGRHAAKCEATRFTINATNQTCRLNHCVRGVNDLPRRAAMDQGGGRFRKPASLARGRLARNQRQSSGLSVVLGGALPKTKT